MFCEIPCLTLLGRTLGRPHSIVSGSFHQQYGHYLHERRGCWLDPQGIGCRCGGYGALAPLSLVCCCVYLCTHLSLCAPSSLHLHLPHPLAATAPGIQQSGPHWVLGGWRKARLYLCCILSCAGKCGPAGVGAFPTSRHASGQVPVSYMMWGWYGASSLCWFWSSSAVLEPRSPWAAHGLCTPASDPPPIWLAETAALLQGQLCSIVFATPRCVMHTLT